MRIAIIIISVIIGIIFLAFVGLLAYSSFTKNHFDYPSQDDISHVDDIVKGYMEHEHTHALSIGIYVDGEQTFYNYGALSKGDQTKPTENTIYEIGSITKTFVATLLAELISESKLTLEDPISKYLPAGTCNWSSDKSITLKELATHTSGLPRIPIKLIFGGIDNPYVNFGNEELYDFLKKYKPSAKDKRQESYSNLGFGLLAHILELATGQSFDELLSERIYAQADMTSSMTSMTAEEKQRFAQGHDTHSKEVPGWDFQAIAGAGAIRSTTKDMLNYFKEQMKNETWSMAYSDAYKTDGQHRLAWVVFPSEDGKEEMVLHNGGTGGFSSYGGIINSSDIAIVVLSNTSNSVDRIGYLLLNSLLNENIKLPK